MDSARYRFADELAKLLEQVHVSASGRRFTEEERTKVQDAASDLTSTLVEAMHDDFVARERRW